MSVGPTIQQGCFDIALRFRKHEYAFSCDINKMYRQIHINPAQTSLQRILWRNNDHEDISVYEINRLTFGTASAPFLATRVLKQLAIDEQNEFPLASKTLQNDFFCGRLPFRH